MNRIVGLWYRQGRPVTPSDLDPLLAAFDGCQPQGVETCCGNSLGLGVAHLWTAFPSLPAHSSGTQPLIVADARIDNRKDLLYTLDLPPDVNDATLIRSAFQRWGSDCPHHLLGDFAFAIWDPRQQHLFCARDPLGVKPFYYYLSPHLFLFASEIRGLLASPEIPRRVNDLKIAGYLVKHRSAIASLLDERTQTLYTEIQPLPPGHGLLITPESHQQQSYWELDPQQETRLKSDQEYAEAFREIFTDAVRCRLQGDHPVGILLSGGLDSSSVACTARQLLPQDTALPIFSAIFPSLPPKELQRVDDRPYLQAVLAQGGYEPHLFEADRLSPLREEERLYTHADECLLAPNFYLARTAFRLAQSNGIRVMLDGLDGDIVVSHGFGRLSELARSGNWLELLRQMRMAPLLDCSPWGLYWQYLWRIGLKPRLVRGPLRQLWQRFMFPDSDPVGSLVNPDLARRVDLAEWVAAERQRRSQFPGVRGEHYLGITSSLLQTAIQAVGKAAAERGIEARHPFFDRRLVEFCLSLPAQQKLARGWTRVVLRQAMGGVIPPQVQWRQKKARLSASFNRGLLQFEHPQIRKLLLQESDRLAPYVRLEEIQNSYDCLIRSQGDFTSVESSRSATVIWLLLNLSLWLKQHGMAS